MKSVAPTHAQPDQNTLPPRRILGTTLTQSVAYRLLVAAPALALLWLMVVWALQ